MYTAEDSDSSSSSTSRKRSHPTRAIPTLQSLVFLNPPTFSSNFPHPSNKIRKLNPTLSTTFSYIPSSPVRYIGYDNTKILFIHVHLFPKLFLYHSQLSQLPYLIVPNLLNLVPFKLILIHFLIQY